MLHKLGEQVQGKPGTGQQWVANIGIAVAVCITYFLTAQLGLALLNDPERVAVFWPAAGVATGTLLALGRWARAPVAVAVTVATLAANLMGDRGIWAALSFALCNTGEALFTAWLIERFFGPHFSLHNLRNVFGLLASAAVASAAAAVAAAVAMSLFGPSAAPLFSVWWDWFVSDALGIITVAPLLIGLAVAVRDAPPWQELIEGTLALAVLAASSHFALALMSGPCATIASVTVLFPLLLWLGARCRPVFTAAAVFVIGAVIVWTTTYDLHSDTIVSIATRLLDAQVAILAATLTALALAALFADRRQHEAIMAERDAQLELAGKTALVGSYVKDIAGKMHISPGYAAIHGLPEGTTETTAENWRARVHPDDLELLEASRNKVFAERWCEHNAEYRIIGPNGNVRWIEARALISYGGDGRVQRIVGINIDVTDRKRGEEHQRLLIAELDHRVKNVLATVQAVAAQTMQASSSMEHFVAAFDGRIRSMGSTHELLSHRRWLGIPLAELVERELAPYTTGSNTEIGGPEVMVSAEAAQTMAMVLHELATNAAKYGPLSAPSGRVSIRWRLPLNGSASDWLVLTWQETGGPLVVPPTKSGYGMDVVRSVVPYELGGTVDHVFAPEGARCQMEIPLVRLSGRSSQSN
jgi:PAS domain S-box-containing protein